MNLTPGMIDSSARLLTNYYQSPSCGEVAEDIIRASIIRWCDGSYLPLAEDKRLFNELNLWSGYDIGGGSPEVVTKRPLLTCDKELVN